MNKKKNGSITYVSGTENIFIIRKGTPSGVSILSKREIANTIDR